jgi:hypothetical protein
MPGRRFPPPWTVQDHNDACFIVKDRNGFAVAYLCYEEERGQAPRLIAFKLPCLFGAVP